MGVVVITTDELVSAVYRDWGEDSTNSVVSIVQVTAMLNKAQRSLCGEGMILLTCAKTTTVAGQETYNLPADYWKMECPFWYGTTPTHLLPMNVGDRDPRQRTGSPTNYYIWGSNVSSANQYVLGLNPIPAVNGSTNDLEVFYRQMPRKMIHSTEGTAVAPEVNEMWQDAMTEYALMSIYRRLGGDFKDLYKDHRAVWQNFMQKAKEYVNPLQFDYPISRRDTGLYTWEYTNA